MKIIQRLQIQFRWSYLVLGVDVARGRIRWGWSKGMKQQQLAPLLEEWPMDGVIWDGASSHRGKLMGQLGFARIFLPSYSPELNPAERVFEEVRRHIEGKVYPSLKAKQLAIDHFLRQLRSDQNRLRRLIGWNWIQRTIAQLPNP